MTEEERAALYRREQQAGERAALARWKASAGSAMAYKARLAATEPLRRDEGWDPVELLTEEERLQVGNG